MQMVRKVSSVAILLLLSITVATADTKSEAAKVIIEYGRKIGKDLGYHIAADLLIKWFEEHIWTPQTGRTRATPKEREFRKVWEKLCADRGYLSTLEKQVVDELRCTQDWQACVRANEPSVAVPACTVLIQSSRERGAN